MCVAGGWKVDCRRRRGMIERRRVTSPDTPTWECEEEDTRRM